MQLLGRFVHSLTFPNKKSFTWPLVVVKNLRADGLVGSDSMKESGAITDHSTNSVYFQNNNSDTAVNFEGAHKCDWRLLAKSRKLCIIPGYT